VHLWQPILASTLRHIKTPQINEVLESITKFPNSKTLATTHFHKPKYPIKVDFNVLPEIRISAEDFDVLDVIIKVE